MAAKRTAPGSNAHIHSCPERSENIPLRALGLLRSGIVLAIATGCCIPFVNPYY
jgi:hypothetical protein